MRKNTVQTKQWLDKHYPHYAPSKTTICRWFADFKRGRTDTSDAERSGRPNDAVIPENVEKTLKMIMADRKVKVREIAEALKISAGLFPWSIFLRSGPQRLLALCRSQKDAPWKEIWFR